jgi:peptidoglycan/xylan/chitin deacetylase (PgdA/CDA1 family)
LFAALVTLCLLTAAASTVALAKSWPQPAAGPSASGDVEVLFTFDDGPSPVHTGKVLDTLAKFRVKAVFFLTGNMTASKDKRVPPLLARMQRDGHIIANHTQSHLDECRTTPEKAAADIDDGKATIERVTGFPLAWIRIPFGARCDRVDALLAERGLWHFHWDLDPQEWKHKDPEQAFQYVTAQIARAQGRVVVLMHDIQPATVAALPRILAWIAEENVRRAKAKRPRIRILQAPAYAIERLTPGLADLFGAAAAGIRDLPATVASVLP